MAVNGIINMVQTIKEIYPTDVILIKTGTFYNAYLKDALILSYVFNYKIKKIDTIYNVCGFPVSNINKIKCGLEQREINYRLIDRAHNYEEEENEDFKSKNKYEIEYEKAYRYLILKNRIDTINTYLLENINNPETRNLINEIERVINEKR